MGETTAKVHISLVDGVLQLEGSESFVAEQLAKLEPHIVRAFERQAPKQDGGAKLNVGGNSETGADGASKKSFNDFDHLFAESNGKIQLLKSPPGNNNAQKTVSVALLLCYATSLGGAETISADAIRDTCKAHACLDGSNFVRALKNEKELFLLEGTSRSKDVRLTVPGKKRAEDLAKQLNAA